MSRSKDGGKQAAKRTKGRKSQKSAALPKSDKAAELPQLLIGVYDADGVFQHSRELDDPRILYCEKYNSLKTGRTARPIIRPLETMIVFEVWEPYPEGGGARCLTRVSDIHEATGFAMAWRKPTEIVKRPFAPCPEVDWELVKKVTPVVPAKMARGKAGAA